jgi:hypothetical protein
MEDLSRYYTLLRDPARRKIIEILGTQEKIGFKELRQTLNLGVGTVYYHLDMLSNFLAQDKQRKYRLNERGQALYKVLKEGQVPATLQIGETFSHRIAKWLFLSPVFAKTSKLQLALPISVAVLVVGAVGASYGKLDPALFFYLKYSTYDVSGIIALCFANWIGLFLLAELLTYVLYKRVGNDIQLFSCVGIASFPLMIFPYVFVAVPAVFPSMNLVDWDMIRQYALVPLQVWSILLFSAALCFGKGIRLDKAVVISLTAVYLNITALFLLGRFA